MVYVLSKTLHWINIQEKVVSVGILCSYQSCIYIFLYIFSESASNSSDDEPSIKAGKHPQVTKILRIILERCDGEEAGATGSLNKTSTGTAAYITKSILML